MSDHYIIKIKSRKEDIKMKTKEQFESIQIDFRNTINGKSGDTFTKAVFQFMNRHKFQTPTFSCLHESNTGNIMFFSDHPFNDIGIIFIEMYGMQSAFYVGSKTEVKMILRGIH